MSFEIQVNPPACICGSPTEYVEHGCDSGAPPHNHVRCTREGCSGRRMMACVLVSLMGGGGSPAPITPEQLAEMRALAEAAPPPRPRGAQVILALVAEVERITRESTERQTRLEREVDEATDGAAKLHEELIDVARERDAIAAEVRARADAYALDVEKDERYIAAPGSIGHGSLRFKNGYLNEIVTQLRAIADRSDGVASGDPWILRALRAETALTETVAELRQGADECERFGVSILASDSMRAIADRAERKLKNQDSQKEKTEP